MNIELQPATMKDLCPVAVSHQDSAATVEDQPETANESHILLLKQKKYCDVTFTFQNLPDRIEAHEFCLKARSPVFENIFRMRKSGCVLGNEIEVSESTPARFQEFLEFIYADVFKVDIAGALDLLQLAQKYKIQPLTKKCEELLKSKIQVEHSVNVFETARRYDRQDLMDRASEIMIKSFLDLLKIGALKNAEEGTIMFLLQRDDLKVEEVKLFELIMEWGKNQKSACDDEEESLKIILKQVISVIRYTNMTPYEFNKVVVPTGLLSAEETLTVYSYFLADEAMRKNLKITFNINSRKKEKIERYIGFYADEKMEAVTAAVLPKQHVSFKAERLQIVKKVWSDFPLQKTVITGIQLWFPEARNRERGFRLNFNLSIRENSGPVDEENFEVRFQKTLLNCKEEEWEDVSVEPPIEFVTGSTYCVIVEDQSTSDLHDIFVEGLFLYDGITYSEITPEVSVDMDGTRVTLKQIKRSSNIELNGQKSCKKYPKISLITGITLGVENI